MSKFKWFVHDCGLLVCWHEGSYWRKPTNEDTNTIGQKLCGLIPLKDDTCVCGTELKKDSETLF